MKWNELVKSKGSKSGAFLQTLEWGAFQKAIGRAVFYIASIDGEVKLLDEAEARQTENLDGLALAILMPISFGKKFLYIPRGPLGKNAEQIIELAKQIAEKEKAIFVKVEPPPSPSPQGGGKTTSYKLQATSSFNLQPEKTVILDLTKDAKELLAAMHTKTRYNIALARRHNVQIVKATTDEQFNQWFELMNTTARRDGFHAHPKNYYKKLLDNMWIPASAGMTEGIAGMTEGIAGMTEGIARMTTALWLALDGEEILAGNLMGYFNNTVTYLHGASSNTKRNLMAPFLLHWEIILDAQRAGYTAYDFWGIDSKKWPGITRFKQNFGNEATLREIVYPKAIDITLNKFWRFLYNLKKIKM